MKFQTSLALVWLYMRLSTTETSAYYYFILTAREREQKMKWEQVAEKKGSQFHLFTHQIVLAKLKNNMRNQTYIQYMETKSATETNKYNYFEVVWIQGNRCQRFLFSFAALFFSLSMLHSLLIQVWVYVVWLCCCWLVIRNLKTTNVYVFYDFVRAIQHK